VEENSNQIELEKGKQLLLGGGLAPALTRARQEQEGYNELPANNPKNLYLFFLDVLKEPMVYLLLGCGITYFFLGDRQEAIMLLSFLLLIIGITIAQESKAERALETLRELSSPRAEVLRNGKKIRIPGREVVREDILFLNEGDRVSADTIIITCSNFTIDESLVTGESVPVEKNIASPLFAGTSVVRGSGIALVQAIGSKTQIGKIGQSIKEIQIVSTKLEEQTNQLVKHLAWFALALCILVFVVYSSTHHNWIQGSLVGLSLGMAILPNELPAVLTIFFALGAWRLSKRKVLTRKISAVENLGSITVLCVDKTGTLTLNQMAIQMIYSQEKVIDISDSKMSSLPEEFHETLEFGILASRQDPFDPMEIAFTTAGGKYLKGTEHLHYDWNLEKEYPLSPELLSITHAWKPNSGGGFVVGAKGAPEAIINLCHLNEEQTKKIQKKAEQMASLGLRVLGVAKSHTDDSLLPPKQHDFEFIFLGLIGITDPIRSGVQESITECHSAGIRVMMLTGDHPITASSIAKKIGLKNPDQVITGSQMEILSDAELIDLTKKINIFSRVMPSQKLRLVESLKKSGEIVAMTGDGVNDAPALKSAHVGIAMGGRGTDVARESSDIVLLDDDFSSIVEAIRTGRRIYSNIKSALVYLFAIHIPIAGMSVLPVILGLPLVLLPSHIAFLHLIIEPASSIAFEVEPASDDLMKKKPRSPNEPLYNNEIWRSSLLRGVILFIALSSIYFISLWRNQGEEDARTLVFSTLILSNTLLIFLSRGSKISLKSKLKTKPNNVVKWLIIASILMLACALYIPELRNLLRFSFLHPIDILICVLVSLANCALSEISLKIAKNK
jgi:Ca2+-transporting ATPase